MDSSDVDRKVKVVALSETLTRAILDELGERGFVQVDMTLVDGRRLVGMDYRAKPICPEEAPPMKAYAADHKATVYSHGSCVITSVIGDYVTSWTLPDEMCPPHRHPH